MVTLKKIEKRLHFEALQVVPFHDGWTVHRNGLPWILKSSDNRVEFRVWDSDQSKGTLTVKEV